MPDEPTRQYEDAYLWTPADRVRLEELREDLQSSLQRAASLSIGDGPRTMGDERSEAEEHQLASAQEHRDAAAALDAFVEEAKSRARVVRVVALPRRRWRALKDAHPVRMVKSTSRDDDGNDVETEVPHEIDQVRGFNAETMADALVPECVAGFSSRAAADEFLDDLSEPDFDTLYAAALKVNIGGFAPPKAEFSSRVDRIIGAISSSRDRSD